MRVALVADVHLGNPKRFGGQMEMGMNARCREKLAVLQGAVIRAIDGGAEVFAVLGDVFDDTRPKPQLIAAAGVVLGKRLGMNVVLVVGNHDRDSMELGDYALSPYEIQDYQRMHVVQRALVTTYAVFVAHHVGNAREYVPRVLAEIKTARAGGLAGKLLCLHCGLVDETTPPWLKDAENAIEVLALDALCQQYGIAGVAAGDWHERRTVAGTKVPMLQIGALVPTGWQNEGISGRYGTLAWWDTDTRCFNVEELPGPRFVTCSRPSPLLAKGTPAAPLRVRIVVPPDEVASAEEYARGLPFETWVCPDEKAAGQQLQAAGHAARAESTITDALEAYTKQAVPAEVFGEVLEAARRYLSRME